MIRLYHFTAREYLRGIAAHGLTVGDVPLTLETGTVGVWLTSSPDAHGHGLEGGYLEKRAIRLAVNVTESPPLVRWSEWAPTRVEPNFLDALNSEGGSDSWYIFFGVIRPERIVECFDLRSGVPIADWQRLPPSPDDLRGVPPHARERWRRATLRKTLAFVRSRQ